MNAWLRLFRIVNVPTVPGDALVGAALTFTALLPIEFPMLPIRKLVASVIASVALYLYGLVDNDIVGAAKDADRPIPEGAISMAVARVARGACLVVALLAGRFGALDVAWWFAALALLVCIVLYNRTKWAVLMGLCRGLDVVCGSFAIHGFHVFFCGTASGSMILLASGVVAAFTIYIAVVTKYSEGEAEDPSKKATVGMLIGAIVYLQLFALIAAYFIGPSPATRLTLIGGAVMLVLLRLMKRVFPKVSAS